MLFFLIHAKVKVSMSSNTIISVVNRLSTVVTNLQNRVDAIVNDSTTKRSGHGDQGTSVTSNISEKLDALDTIVKELKLSSAQGKDDLSRERNLIESSIMFKAEQYVNRSIKERMDIMNITFDDKLRKVDVESRIEQAIRKHLQDFEFKIRGIVDEQVRVGGGGGADASKLQGIENRIKDLEGRINSINNVDVEKVVDEKVRTIVSDTASIKSKIQYVEERLKVNITSDTNDRISSIETKLRDLETELIKSVARGGEVTATPASEPVAEIVAAVADNSEFVQARRKIGRGRGK